MEEFSGAFEFLSLKLNRETKEQNFHKSGKSTTRLNTLKITPPSALKNSAQDVAK